MIALRFQTDLLIPGTSFYFMYHTGTSGPHHRSKSQELTISTSKCYLVSNCITEVVARSLYFCVVMRIETMLTNFFLYICKSFKRLSTNRRIIQTGLETL